MTVVPSASSRLNRLTRKNEDGHLNRWTASMLNRDSGHTQGPRGLLVLRKRKNHNYLWFFAYNVYFRIPVVTQINGWLLISCIKGTIFSSKCTIKRLAVGLCLNPMVKLTHSARTHCSVPVLYCLSVSIVGSLWPEPVNEIHKSTSQR